MENKTTMQKIMKTLAKSNREYKAQVADLQQQLAASKAETAEKTNDLKMLVERVVEPLRKSNNGLRLTNMIVTAKLGDLPKEKAVLLEKLTAQKEQSKTIGYGQSITEV